MSEVRWKMLIWHIILAILASTMYLQNDIKIDGTLTKF